jgi:malonate-semialdehyde dehydrogenase (acetylating)/methylmalonate-semialdehyde dehydrogenase
MTTPIAHWVDGTHFEGRPEQWADVMNPATGKVSGRVALAGQSDA